MFIGSCLRLYIRQTLHRSSALADSERARSMSRRRSAKNDDCNRSSREQPRTKARHERPSPEMTAEG